MSLMHPPFPVQASLTLNPQSSTLLSLTWWTLCILYTAVPKLFDTRGRFPGRPFLHISVGLVGHGVGGNASDGEQESSRWNTAHSPAAHFLLCGQVPNPDVDSAGPCFNTLSGSDIIPLSRPSLTISSPIGSIHFSFCCFPGIQFWLGSS